MEDPIGGDLLAVLREYQTTFSSKEYSAENEDVDALMAVFGITPTLKRENRQYWGRELGKCWERLLKRLFEVSRPSDFAPPLRIGSQEPCDFLLGDTAIDTKYRIGSGDSGTLRKFTEDGLRLQERGYSPTVLILREDNLLPAINSFRKGGWSVYTGDGTFQYIQTETGFDVESWLNVVAENASLNLSR